MKKSLCLLICLFLLIAASCAPSDLRDQSKEENLKDTLAGGESNKDNSVGESDGSTIRGEYVPVYGDPYDYVSNDLTGFIKLGQYKGLKADRGNDEVTDDDFEKEIENLLNNYAYYNRITNRKVAAGDTVVADYAGYLNGVAFEGGTALEQEIVASPNSGYIPGFAEAFVGRMPGEEFSFNVTFPADYQNKDLAGKEVTFKCKVHAVLDTVLIVPELTDDFVKETFGYNNAEEFLIAFRRTVEVRKETTEDMELYNELWNTILSTSTVIAYPENEVDRLYTQTREYYEQYAEMYSTDYETFVQVYLNTTDEAIYEECKSYVKEDLVLNQISKELKVELSDEKFNEGLYTLSEYYMMTKDELLKYYGEEAIRSTLTWQELMSEIVKFTVVNQK